LILVGSADSSDSHLLAAADVAVTVGVGKHGSDTVRIGTAVQETGIDRTEEIGFVDKVVLRQHHYLFT
jgi:hypothetical protein